MTLKPNTLKKLSMSYDEIAATRVNLDAWELDIAIQAINGGATWAQVGSILGVSRQAAQQRFGRYVDAGAES